MLREQFIELLLSKRNREKLGFSKSPSLLQQVSVLHDMSMLTLITHKEDSVSVLKESCAAFEEPLGAVRQFISLPVSLRNLVVALLTLPSGAWNQRGLAKLIGLFHRRSVLGQARAI